MSRDELRNRLRAAAVELADALLDALTADTMLAAPTDGPDNTLLTVAQLAERLHRSPSTTRAWVERGLFVGAVKVGRGWLIPAGLLAGFLKRHASVAPPGVAIAPAPVGGLPRDVSRLAGRKARISALGVGSGKGHERPAWRPWAGS